MDAYSYNLSELIEEVMKHYPSKSDLVFSILFVDKYAKEQSFIELNSDENFTEMLSMYDEEKEQQTNYGANTIAKLLQYIGHDEVVDEPYDDDGFDYRPGEESYHSRCSSDGEDELLNYEGEVYAYNRGSPVTKVESKFPNVIAFRRALNHHGLKNEFDYFIEKIDPKRFTARCAKRECEWRIHASILQNGVTFEVKKLVETHSCIRTNKCGNKCATQGWIADVVSDKIKSDGDVSPAELKKWLMKVTMLTYHI